MLSTDRHPTSFKEEYPLAQKPILISVTLSARTFKKFAVFNAMRRQRRWILPVGMAVICFGFSIASFTFQETLPWGNTLGSILSALTVLIPFGYFRSFYSSVDKQAERMKLTEPRHVYSIELAETPESIRFYYPGDKEPSDRFSWRSIEGAWRTEHAIYIYVTPERALLIPDIIKNADHDKLWEFLQKQLGPDKMHDCRKRGLLF